MGSSPFHHVSELEFYSKTLVPFQETRAGGHPVPQPRNKRVSMPRHTESPESHGHRRPLTEANPLYRSSKYSANLSRRLEPNPAIILEDY